MALNHSLVEINAIEHVQCVCVWCAYVWCTLERTSEIMLRSKRTLHTPNSVHVSKNVRHFCQSILSLYININEMRNIDAGNVYSEAIGRIGVSYFAARIQLNKSRLTNELSIRLLLFRSSHARNASHMYNNIVWHGIQKLPVPGYL